MDYFKKTGIVAGLITLFSLTVFGQGNTVFNTGMNELKAFSIQEFIDNDFTTVSAYSYTINEKGKLKKDSLLLYRQECDIFQNRLFGTNSSIVYQTSGPSFRTWYEFETYFDDKGQVIKNIRTPKNIEKKVEFGATTYNEISNETEYEYDDLNRLLKETYRIIDHYYSISKYTKDTFHLHSIQSPKIYEYFYNSDNQTIRRYYTVDSTRYLKTKSYDPEKKSDAVRCSYCHSRHLNVEWKYNSDKQLIEWISYTRENKIHTKRNYFYDDKQRLATQIDSTGWYHTTKKPYWRLITTTQYSDTGKIVTKTYNIEEEINFSQIVEYQDASGNVIKQCYVYSDNTEECATHSFFYDENKLVKKEDILLKGDIRTTEYYYNEKGFLIEESQKINQKLTQLIRYYYE